MSYFMKSVSHIPVNNANICRSRSASPIYSLCVTKGAVMFSRMNSPTVEIWDSIKERVRDVFSMDTLFG